MSWSNVVLIPCRNEEASIQDVIEHIRLCDPTSRIVVIDNASSDQTGKKAAQMGVDVLYCEEPGKGRALKMALDMIEADSYTFIDGDGTYEASLLPQMIQAVRSGAGMAVGVRKANSKKAFPRYHRLGNWIFSQLLSVLFARPVQDVLTGFRVLSRDFVLFSPLTVKGFEVEAFYTLEAVVRDLKIREFPIGYYERAPGGKSKLNSFRDGFRILLCIFDLFRTYRPLPFFSILAMCFFVMGLCSGYQPILEFAKEGYVYAVPRAVLAAALMNLSFICLGFGFLLSNHIRCHFQSLQVQRNLHLAKNSQSSSRRAA